jgi:hypothetical protein
MSVWSPTKFHQQSGRYCRYQETGQITRLLEASSWAALEPDHPDCHDHYFKINGRWYVYAETPNHFLFKQPTAAGVTLIDPGEQLDARLSELKQLEPFPLTQPVSEGANPPPLTKRAYRGVIYDLKPTEPSTMTEPASEGANPPPLAKRVYRGVIY